MIREPNRFPLLAFLVAVTLVAGCVRERKDVVARVGTHEITVADIESRRDTSGLPNAEPALVLEELIEERVLLNHAEDLGIDESAAFVRARDQLLLRFLEEQAIRPELETIELTEDERREYYEANRDRFRRPGQRRFALIWKRFPEDSDRDTLREEMETIREAAVARTDDPDFQGFGDLAAAHSDDFPSRDRGGDIGWAVAGVANYRWGPEVNAAAFALEEAGQVSEVLPTDRGLYLVRLLDLREPTCTPLDEVPSSTWRRLLDRKRAEAREALIAELKSAARIERFPERLGEAAPAGL